MSDLQTRGPAPSIERRGTSSPSIEDDLIDRNSSFVEDPRPVVDPPKRRQAPDDAMSRARMAIIGRVAAGFWLIFVCLNFFSAVQAAKHFLAREIYVARIQGTIVEYSLPVIGMIDQRALFMAAGMVAAVSLLAFFFEQWLDQEQYIGAAFLAALFLGFMTIESFGAYSFALGSGANLNYVAGQLSGGIAAAMVFMEGLTAYFATKGLLMQNELERIELAERSKPKKREYRMAEQPQNPGRLREDRQSAPTGLSLADHEYNASEFLGEAADVAKNYEALQSEIDVVIGRRVAKNLPTLEQVFDGFRMSVEELETNPLLRQHGDSIDPESWRGPLQRPADDQMDPVLWRGYCLRLSAHIASLSELLNGSESFARTAEQNLRSLESHLASKQRLGMSRGWDAWRAKGEDKLRQDLNERLREAQRERETVVGIKAPMVRRGIPETSEWLEMRRVIDTSVEKLKSLNYDLLSNQLRMTPARSIDDEQLPAELYQGRQLTKPDIDTARSKVNLQSKTLAQRIKGFIDLVRSELSVVEGVAKRLEAVAKQSTTQGPAMKAQPTTNAVQARQDSALTASLSALERQRQQESAKEKEVEKNSVIQWYRLLKAYRTQEEKRLRSSEGLARFFGGMALTHRLNWFNFAIRTKRIPLALQVFKLEFEEEAQRQKAGAGKPSVANSTGSQGAGQAQ